jgi:hypothetical protein
LFTAQTHFDQIVAFDLSIKKKKWMLDSWFMHDYEQNCAFDCTKNYVVCDLCLLGFGLNVHHVLGVWSDFVRYFYVFLSFYLFLV